MVTEFGKFRSACNIVPPQKCFECKKEAVIILKFDSTILIPTTTTPLIYPYFFVNLDTQGVSGVLMWIGILAVVFAAAGFAFFGIDRLGKKNN